MNKPQMTLKWEGTFIELCMDRVTPVQNNYIKTHCPDLINDVQSLWYDNTEMLKSVFKVNNWWSVDALDHAMGLVFTDRSVLEKKLAAITFEIDGTPVAIDPEAMELSFFSPEAIDPLKKDERVVYHGIKRRASLILHAECETPFDPSLVSLSFLHYPHYGYILIDLDVNGHDDVNFEWGDKTYLDPLFLTVS